MPLLNNRDRLPLVFSVSCYVGFFDNPGESSLGEKLVKSPDKGAIGHFGSGAIAWMYGNYLLNDGLFTALFVNGRRRIGQITTEGKLYLMRTGGYYEMAEAYTLLGDPAVRLALPEENVILDVARQGVFPGKPLSVEGHIRGEADGIAVCSGTVRITAYDGVDSLVAQETTEVAAGQFQFDIPIPSDAHMGKGTLKAYFWGENVDGIGMAGFAIGIPGFRNVHLRPPAPVHGTSIYVVAETDPGAPLDSTQTKALHCLWSTDGTHWTPIPMRPDGEGAYVSQEPYIRV